MSATHDATSRRLQVHCRVDFAGEDVVPPEEDRGVVRHGFLSRLPWLGRIYTSPTWGGTVASPSRAWTSAPARLLGCLDYQGGEANNPSCRPGRPKQRRRVDEEGG